MKCPNCSSFRMFISGEIQYFEPKGCRSREKATADIRIVIRKCRMCGAMKTQKPIIFQIRNGKYLVPRRKNS